MGDGRSPLTGFVALLRAAGMPVGSERVLLAHQAVDRAGMASRARLHAALRATLVVEAGSLPLFDAAFDLYWQAPNASLAALLPQLPPHAHLVPRRPPPAGMPRRLLDAITPPHAWRPADAPPPAARLGASSADLPWQQRRFEELGAEEWPLLRRAARRLAHQLQRRARSRRWQAAPTGPVDLRAALRGLQAGRLPLPLPRHRPRPVPHRWIWLGDVSGSMQEATRALLLWAHAQAQGRPPGQHWRFWSFGTRLQALTPLLRSEPDPDACLRRLADLGVGGEGGTRIGAALQALWDHEGPRVQGGRCTLLLVSDGLDHAREDPLLTAQLAAWRARGVRLWWLDPLPRATLDASAALARGCDARWPLQRWADLLGTPGGA